MSALRRLTAQAPGLSVPLLAPQQHADAAAAWWRLWRSQAAALHLADCAGEGPPVLMTGATGATRGPHCILRCTPCRAAGTPMWQRGNDFVHVMLPFPGLGCKSRSRSMRCARNCFMRSWPRPQHTTAGGRCLGRSKTGAYRLPGQGWASATNCRLGGLLALTP